MVWADFVVLGIVIFLPYLGYKRGLVAEVCDWFTFGISFAIALRLYRSLGSWFHASVASSWSRGACDGVAFCLIWVPLAVTLGTLAIYLDRITHESNALPDQVKEWGGGGLALVKAVVLAVLFVACVKMSNMVLPQARPDFRTAPIVQAVRGLNGAVEPLVELVMPTPMAHHFISKGMDKNF